MSEKTKMEGPNIGKWFVRLAIFFLLLIAGVQIWDLFQERNVVIESELDVNEEVVNIQVKTKTLYEKDGVLFQLIEPGTEMVDGEPKSQEKDKDGKEIPPQKQTDTLRICSGPKSCITVGVPFFTNMMIESAVIYKNELDRRAEERAKQTQDKKKGK